MGFPRFAVLAVALLAAACGAPAAGQQPASGDGALVGVTMPTTKSERWISDGENIKRDLESRGHRVDLRYAENDVANQVKQIEDQIAKGAKLLIIASVDGSALTKPLDTAANAEIPVIAYDRLLRNSPNVDFYATFENFRVGIYQAESLLTGLGLRNPDGSPGAATGPFNIELFAGSADDNNSAFFFNGAMSCSGRTSTTASWWCAAVRRTSRPSRPCGGTARPPASAWRRSLARHTAVPR